MNETIKKIIGLAATIAIIALFYYGTWAPYAKSTAFIDALRTTPRSVSQFEDVFSVPLDMSSPIGQEELVRNTGNSILSIVQQKNTNPQVTEDLLAYLEKYYQPIIERGTGMSFEQNLYILGVINELAYIQTKQPHYFETSRSYFEQGLALGPKRPQFLYGMFDVLRMMGDYKDARILGEQILLEWPADEKTISAMATLPTSNATGTTP